MRKQFYYFSLSQFQTKYTLEEITNSPMVFQPLTKLQCWWVKQSQYQIISIAYSVVVPFGNNLSVKPWTISDGSITLLMVRSRNHSGLAIIL